MALKTGIGNYHYYSTMNHKKNTRKNSMVEYKHLTKTCEIHTGTLKTCQICQDKAT